jgi:hypothetical protein
MRYCGRLPGVEIHRGSILDVQCDAAAVAPAVHPARFAGDY